MKENGKKLFSIVLPVYGNEHNLPVTVPYIIDHLDLFSEYEVEIIMVCDGSPDRSWEVMKALRVQFPDIIRIYKFNKNYYRQIAVACGFEKARGDVIGTISADMQDPVELFADMLKKWEEGSRLVAACRKKRTDPGIGWIMSNMFHKFLTHINSNYPKGGFDFFLIDKSLIKPYCDRITKEGFMPLVLLSLVERPCYIEYERRAREIGTSGYTFLRKLNTIVTTMVIETDRLFYWLIFIGLMVCGLSLLGALVFAIAYGRIYPILFGIFGFLDGIVLSFCGLLGVSIYNWAQNLRNLPKYIIEEEE